MCIFLFFIFLILFSTLFNWFPRRFSLSIPSMHTLSKSCCSFSKGSKNGWSRVYFLYEYVWVPRYKWYRVKCVWHGRIYGNVMDLNNVCGWILPIELYIRIVSNSHLLFYYTSSLKMVEFASFIYSRRLNGLRRNVFGPNRGPYLLLLI